MTSFGELYGMRMVFSEDIPEVEDEQLSHITDQMMGDEPKPMDVAGLIDKDWASIPRDVITDFLKRRQADGYSSNALKWAAQYLIGQVTGLPSAQAALDLQPGTWHARKITNVMSWIDAEHIPLSHPSLQTVSESIKAAEQWEEREVDKGLAKTKPVSESAIVYKFPDGWNVVSISEEDLDHEGEFLKTDDIYVEKAEDAMYSFKDKDGVTHAIISTRGNTMSETFEIRGANHADQDGANHVKQWTDVLRVNGQIISSSISNESSDPDNARELGEYLLDDYGLPVLYSSWGGSAETYCENILKTISYYDVYQYGMHGRSREAADALVDYAILHNELDKLEQGRQNAQDQNWESFVSNFDDSYMTNKRPDESDFDMENNAKAFHDAQEAYDEEFMEIESEEGWSKFDNYLYKAIEAAKAVALKREKARKKAWKATRTKMTAMEKARLENEQAEAIARGMDQEASSGGWYRFSKGISKEDWSAMIRKASFSS